LLDHIVNHLVVLVVLLVFVGGGAGALFKKPKASTFQIASEWNLAGLFD